MKSLFGAISELAVEDDFSIHFQILGIQKGYEIAEKWPVYDLVRNKLIKLVAYRYSYESPLLKKKKDPFESKCAICEYLDLTIDDFVMDCIRNRNSDFEQYVTWWLKENGDRDFAELASLEDGYYEQLELVRSGITSFFVVEKLKELSEAMKYFKKMEIAMKGEAAKRATDMRRQIESLSRQIDKNYEYLHKTISAESTELASNLGWAERAVLKRKQSQ